MNMKIRHHAHTNKSLQNGYFANIASHYVIGNTIPYTKYNYNYNYYLKLQNRNKII